MSDENTIIKSLLSLDDLDDIGDVALLDLARSARIERLQKGEKLQADEHLDRHVYLIEGEVHLLAEGKSMGVVRAGSERARLSLFRVHTHGMYALCTRKTALLSLSEQTYKKYIAQKNVKSDNGIQVEEYNPGSQEVSLIREIDTVFRSNEVDLPSLPEVARRIFHGLEDESIPVDTMVELLQSDPAIAARVVQVANSALYGGNNINSLRDAVTLIGFRATHTIVMSVVLRNLYSPNSNNIRRRMSKFYIHSIRVGAIAYTLCKHLEEFDPDYAFLAGLLHDIGVMPLLIQADNREVFRSDMVLLETMLHELSPRVGKKLLEQWGFDPALVSVVRECENWQREPDSPDYCDVIQVAQLHCALLGGVKIDAPPLNQLPAFRRLGLGKIDPLKVVKQAREEVRDVITLLSK